MHNRSLTAVRRMIVNKRLCSYAGSRLIFLILSLTIFVCIFLIKEEERGLNILILSRGRSGSSFLAELLSALPTGYYVHEPFHPLNIKNPNHTFVEYILLGLFGCHPPVIEYYTSEWYTKKGNQSVCARSNPKVVKAIHLDKHLLEPWIFKTDIRIVHLIRDPRGQFFSLRRSHFSEAEKLTTFIQQSCRWREEILTLAPQLGSRYMEVRYEDIVTNPMEVTKQLYKKLGMPFTNRVEEFIIDHISTAGEPLSTFRGPDFKHDKWKTRLTTEEIRGIEHGCTNIMNMFNYTSFFGPSSKLLT